MEKGKIRAGGTALRAAHDAETEAMQSRHCLSWTRHCPGRRLPTEHRLALAAKEDSLSAQQEQSVSTALARQEVW